MAYTYFVADGYNQHVVIKRYTGDAGFETHHVVCTAEYKDWADLVVAALTLMEEKRIAEIPEVIK